jgi:hypothetical protein
MAWPGGWAGGGMALPGGGRGRHPVCCGAEGTSVPCAVRGVLVVGLCALFALAVFGAPWTPRWLDTGVSPDRLREGVLFP